MAIDTLAISNKMKQAGFTPQQAEAQAQLFADIVDSDLATKRDLKDLEVGLKRDIKELDLRIAQVEANLRRDLKDVESNLRRDIKELELKMDKGQSDAQRQMLQVGIGLAAFVIAALGLLFRLFAHP